jgi:hypothetical protein
MKCDLCNVTCDPHVTPAWTYRTVNTVSGPNDPNVPAGMGIWAEDEEWLVCVDCHILIEKKADLALAARSIALQGESLAKLGRTLSPESKAEIVRIHRLFWTALSTEPPVPEPGHRA